MILDDLIRNQYESNNNYKVIDISDSKNCIIYCSSNGLWDYSEESFRNEIIKHDKYEWENLAKHKKLSSYFGRAIFIRDIQMRFYVDGINNKLDCIDKVILLLKSLTKDYLITVVGSSAGGYFAILLGYALNADRVISLGGQFNLKEWGGGNNKLSFSDFTALYRHKDDWQYSKWFDLTKYIDKSKCIVFHFYAGKCIADIKQAEIATGFKNVYKFPMNKDKHGTVVWGFCLPYIITADTMKLERFAKAKSKKLINPFSLALKFVGIIYTIKYLCKKMKHKHQKT